MNISERTRGILAGSLITFLMTCIVHIFLWPKLTKPIPPSYKEVEINNACYINATGFKEAYEARRTLENRSHWAHLVYVDVLTVQGHAMCMFEYDGRFKLYDSSKGTIDIGPFDKENLPNLTEAVKRLSPSYYNGKWFK